MSANHLDQCRSCRAPIYWCVTDKGKPMPVDPHPDRVRGNVSIYPDGGTMRAVVVPKAKAAAMRAQNQNLHLAHFTTCPQGRTWKKNR
ncbi:hypothetical protein L5G28_07585 [Gordonia sp. HY285]|uniref:hypothetical protein n=1 Tax=Gordonia liuliyuniae TaxID=2911517 RepID=UPI001F44D220|nr:hypothetical protein [Gordonia liuliyuniae]MCF8610022.1 hypothetical protein [Gordonia liuliyuniae]